MDTPLDVCETRDVKGLYKKARAGVIKGIVVYTYLLDTFQIPGIPSLL